jgi:hypothetical protein
VAQVVKILPSKCEALSSNTSKTRKKKKTNEEKPTFVANLFHFSRQEEAV